MYYYFDILLSPYIIFFQHIYAQMSTINQYTIKNLLKFGDFQNLAYITQIKTERLTHIFFKIMLIVL